MIAILLNLLILLIVFGVVLYVVDLLPIDGNLKVAARLLVGLILLLILLSYIWPLTGGALRGP